MRKRHRAVSIRVLAAEADAAWLADELTYAWRSAQDEAVSAYQAWCESPGPSEYAAYRAAQDRADQAQDVLSSSSSNSQIPRPSSPLPSLTSRPPSLPA
jgi:hypothetical protein